MKNNSTLFENKNGTLRVALAGLLIYTTTGAPLLHAEEKKIYTHTADLRSGKEDALLDILKPISEEFESEYRALGTA